LKIIGLTGGIGSGKSLVSKYFESKGFPVYNSDDKAKEIMFSNSQLKSEIIELLGENSYVNNQLNRKFIASKVFSNKDLLQKLNQLVHPKVQHDFLEWTINQNANFCIKEAAILFESGAYKNCDLIILVTANDEIRIKRVMQRDNCSKEEVVSRMKTQWNEEDKKPLSNFIIYNNTTVENVYMQVDEIIEKLK